MLCLSWAESGDIYPIGVLWLDTRCTALGLRLRCDWGHNFKWFPCHQTICLRCLWCRLFDWEPHLNFLLSLRLFLVNQVASTIAQLAVVPIKAIFGLDLLSWTWVDHSTNLFLALCLLRWISRNLVTWSWLRSRCCNLKLKLISLSLKEVLIHVSSSESPTSTYLLLYCFSIFLSFSLLSLLENVSIPIISSYLRVGCLELGLAVAIEIF